MKTTVMQYVSLTVMLLLIVVVVSLFPERSAFDRAVSEHSTATSTSISVVESDQK